VLLYDLTSTYFEGLCQKIPKAKHGYNRDGRGDCRQVVIALVVTPDGLPLAYEVLAGNTTDKTTLQEFLAKIEQQYGKARRTWIMDRGIPTEATLKEMREAGTQYLVGTPRSVLGRLAVLKQQAGRMSGAVTVHIPDQGQRPTPQNFHYQLNAEFRGESLERDGSYILRSNATQSDATTMWSMYMQLTFIEAAFKSLKSDLAIRPIFHRLQRRVEAHLFVAFMGYCLMAALRKHLGPAAPGLSPKAVLEQLGAIKMVDVCLPTTDGRWLIMPRYTEPESEQSMLLEKLGLTLPTQPPPRIRAGKLLINEPEDHSMKT
jgi:transposase